MSCVEVPFHGLSCLEQCRSLYSAYVTIMTGKQRVRVAYENYYVEYKPQQATDITMLRDLYTTLRNGCPQAQAELPDLRAAMRARRGPAIFGDLSR